MTLDKAELRDFAERYTAAWCSQDPASVAAFFAPNGTLSVNGVPAVGRDAITEVARGFMTAFPDMVLTMDDVGPRRHATITGRSTATTPGRAGQGSAFASADTRNGRLVRTV